MALYCARLVDEKNTGQAQAAKEAEQLLQILTPIAKSWPSEWGLESNNLAIQVLGGYGYTRDFPVEQYWRDNRLNMIHEGTHGIQALDLLGRKVLIDEGRGLTLLTHRINDTISRARVAHGLAEHADALEHALNQLLSATRSAWADADPDAALANATTYLQGFGHTVMAWVWLDVAVAAKTHAANSAPRDASFFLGKLQAVRYFFLHELPKVAAWLRPSASRDATCREMQDAWF